MDKTIPYARRHGERCVEERIDWLKIPSVSTDPQFSDDVRRAADRPADHLQSRGWQRAGARSSAGRRLAYAEHIVDDSRPTVLVYGHYDAQPPDPLELWESPPFEPVT